MTVHIRLQVKEREDGAETRICKRVASARLNIPVISFWDIPRCGFIPQQLTSLAHHRLAMTNVRIIYGRSLEKRSTSACCGRRKLGTWLDPCRNCVSLQMRALQIIFCVAYEIRGLRRYIHMWWFGTLFKQLIRCSIATIESCGFEQDFDRSAAMYRDPRCSIITI